MSNILITGGSGLLGQELQKQIGQTANVYCPTHAELDVQLPFEWQWKSADHQVYDSDYVIHCAAIKTAACDKDPLEAMRTNIIGTANAVEYCAQNNAKLIYISTDYVFRGDRGNYAPNDEVAPQNYYAETKLAGEYVVKSLPKSKWLIIRLSFYPNEYPYDGGFVDQFTTRVTVTEAAKAILSHMWHAATGIQHICGKKQSVYDFARSTSAPDKVIRPQSIYDDTFNRPKDTSLIYGDSRDSN